MLYLRDSCFYPTLAEIHVLATYVYSSSMKKSCEDSRGKIWLSVLERMLLMSLFDRDFTLELRRYFKNTLYKAMNMKQAY